MSHKQTRNGVSYRIRWKGWAAKDDTWQLEDDLNCAAILKKYQGTLKTVKSPAKSPAKKSTAAAASPKKRGRPPAVSTKSPKKAGVAKGRVEKKMVGRPAGVKKAAASGQKRGRKPKADEEWEVEEVLAVRKTETGEEEFFVKWKGYSTEENTWEPAENVSNCKKAISKFRKMENGGGDEPEEEEKDEGDNAADAEDTDMDAAKTNGNGEQTDDVDEVTELEGDESADN